MGNHHYSHQFFRQSFLVAPSAKPDFSSTPTTTGKQITISRLRFQQETPPIYRFPLESFMEVCLSPSTMLCSIQVSPSLLCTIYRTYKSGIISILEICHIHTEMNVTKINPHFCTELLLSVYILQDGISSR